MDPKSEYLQLCIANILMERDIGTQNIFGEIYLQCDFLLILLCLCVFFFLYMFRKLSVCQNLWAICNTNNGGFWVTQNYTALELSSVVIWVCECMHQSLMALLLFGSSVNLVVTVSSDCGQMIQHFMGLCVYLQWRQLFTFFLEM